MCGTVFEVLPDGRVEQVIGGVLREDAHPVAHLVGRDVSAEVPPRPVVGVEQPAQKLEERALAGAVGAQERQPLAGGDGNVHLVDGIADALQTIQHEMAEHITSVQHVHLSPDTCMETLVVDGPESAITELANRLRALDGVRQMKVVVDS